MIQEENEKSFYGSDSDKEVEEEEDADKEKDEPVKKPYVMDTDHRLLLRSVKPLLQSRNSAVSKEKIIRLFRALISCIPTYRQWTLLVIRDLKFRI